MEGRIWSSNHGPVFIPYDVMRDLESVHEEILAYLNVIGTREIASCKTDGPYSTNMHYFW